MTSPILVAVFTIVYLAVTVWLCRGLKLNARNLAMGGLACALTLILGSIMIPLPTGASITCGSWIPLMLLAVVCDKRLAFVSGWVCGILAMVLIPAWQPVHWAQIFVEQLVCFSCLGYTGVFGTDKRWKILCGYSLTYHLSSKIPEGVLSLVILMVLPLSVLKKAAKGAART